MNYIVGDKTFRTKADLRKFCSEMLNKPTELTQEDEMFLRALIENHPEREQKIGLGIHSFYRRTGEFNRRCFWLSRVDSSETDFSFLSCITPPSHESKVRAAFRTHVTDQIIEFRDARFGCAPKLQCAITGMWINSDEAHVDHEPPDTFRVLTDRFLLGIGAEPHQIQIEPTRDGNTIARLANNEIATCWSAYHRKHAKLRIVHWRANLQQGSGAR